VIVAWVDGEPIRQVQVDAELRRLYASPGRARLAGPDTSEGRQLRRWVIQMLTVVSVLEHEATRRGLAASIPMPDADRVELGGIAAAALAKAPPAAAVFYAITAAVRITPADVSAYWVANPELAADETRLVRHVRAGRPVNGGRPYRIRRGEFLGDLVFAAAHGDRVEDGPDRFEVLGVTECVVPDIAALLLGAARGRVFARWLDVQLRDRVVLAPGAEHPADPSQPDHTHRH
jgi:[acyl-carrier-protein] S-malonyltransferase